MQNPFASNTPKTQPSTNPFDINNYINPKKEQSIFINNPFPPANPPNFSHPEKSTSPPLSNILINSRPIEHYHLQPQESKILKKIEDEYDLKCYEKAIEEYKKNPVTYTHEQVAQLLELE